MLTSIIPVLSSISPILLVVVLLFRDYKSGNSQISKQVTETYKERNDQLERHIEELDKAINDQSIQIVKYKTIVEEKEKQIEKYEKIFANRNPDLTNVLEEIKIFMKSIHEQNRYQTDILEKRQERDHQVDEASKTHAGAPMRAPVAEIIS